MSFLKNTARKFAIAAVATLFAGGAYAACKADKPGDDLSFEEANAVYECLKADMQAGYQKGGKAWVSKDFVNNYPSWRMAATGPAAPGFHGGRFLVTYVNDTGFDAYVEYDEGDTPIPAGTQIAKESFSVNDKGEARPGPLFLMEKVAAGTSPKSDDWFYTMVAPNGKPQAVNVFKACVECHQGNFGEQKGLGFPVEEVRLSK